MKYKARSEVPTAVLITFQVFKNVILEPEDGFKFSWMLFLSPKMDTQRFSDKSVNIYQLTWRNIAEGSNLQWNTLFTEFSSRFDRNQHCYDGIRNDRVAQYFSL
jgi:hypothetical protein